MVETRAPAEGVTLLSSFDGLDAEWEGLLDDGPSAVFMSPGWQREWWRAFGGEQLLIAVLGGAQGAKAIAPMFELDEMLFLVGSGGSDYLDVVGHPDEEELAALLGAARERLPRFEGLRLYHLPHDSPTTALLPGVARRLGLELHREDAGRGRAADLRDPAHVANLTERRSVRKEDERMGRAGELAVREAGPEMLEEFFAQTDARWGDGQGGALDAAGRAFLRGVVSAGVAGGWARLTMLEWRGRAAAFDISLLRARRWTSYMVSRDLSIRAYSPGRVLIRRLAQAALQAGVETLDFGLGEEDYKVRNGPLAIDVANWSMYPPGEER